MAVGKAVLESWIRRAVLEDCFRRAVLEHSFNRTLHQCFGRTRHEKQCCGQPWRLPGPMESDWTWSLGHGLAGGHSHNDVLGQRNSLGTFRLLVQPCNLYMCAKHFSNLKKSHCYQCAGNLHWFHLVSKLAPENCTTWPSGWGWSPGHVDCGDHRHRGNSRSDDIWWHPPSSVWFSRIGLELFIRSPHGPISLDLSMFYGIMKQFAVCGNILANCTWNPESAPMECKIIYKHMQSPEIKRKQSASQHIPSIIFHKSHWKTPSGWLDLMVFDFFCGPGGQVVSSPSCWFVNSSWNDGLNLSTHQSPWNPSSRQRVMRTSRGGGVWERLKLEDSEISEFLYPKEVLKRGLNFPLGFSHIFWERRLNCCGFHKDLWVSFAACMCTSSDFHSVLPFILCHYRFVRDECVSENCWQDQHLPRWKPNPKSSKQFPNLVQKHMNTSDFLILLLLLIISHDSCVTNHDSWIMNHHHHHHLQSHFELWT